MTPIDEDVPATAIFFHVWADGNWQQPLDEFREALGHHGFHAGIVGHPATREQVREDLDDETVVIAEADRGHEHVTLAALHEYVAANPDVTTVLYAHTKGASAPGDEFRVRWRQSMFRRVVARWRENVRLLNDRGADVIGCHWLTSSQYAAVSTPHFAGNVWVAQAAYLRSLPPVGTISRFDAEQWVGVGNPSVIDLLPGWPHDNRWPDHPATGTGTVLWCRSVQPVALTPGAGVVMPGDRIEVADPAVFAPDTPGSQWTRHPLVAEAAVSHYAALHGFAAERKVDA